MRSEADGSLKFSTEKGTGKVSFVRAGAKGDLLPDNKAGKTNPSAKAKAYLDQYAGAFGATASQLTQDSLTKDAYGWTVNFTQSYKGIPVFGSLLRAHVDTDGDLTSVNGEAVPTAGLSTATNFTKSQAGARAVAMVKAQPAVGESGKKADTTGVKAKSTELFVYREGLIKGAEGKTDLVYQTEVTNGKNIRDMVFVSATTGKPVNRYSMIDNALDRELYEISPDTTPVWVEGDALPGTLNVDQENMVRSTGEAYWFFRNAFNRDSYDANGATMKTVNNDPTIACPNANWNGSTTNYCDGVSSDDVVSHEWGHAYTEYTHGLIYQWQPGALNESYSDIWGETLDLINNRQDEGEGDLQIKRPVGQCSKYTRGSIGATINSPAEIAGPCEAAAAAAFGPVFDKTGVTTDMVVAADAENPEGPSATDGCTAFTNAADIAGKFAYVDRGTCAFTVKIANAEAAGATGIVFGDNAPGRPPASVAGVSDLYGLMVTQADGTKIKSAAGPVNLTVKDVDTDEKADSYRWLMGEKSEAFGGAIRDLWNPTCYGDPSKVSDVEYNCSTDDGGGVHSNSGVPNHGYALLVDGGEFNDVSVTGIGMTKAAAIYFRAMTAYQTPASGFPDHADALASSCADLTGKAIQELSTEANDYRRSQEKITATDCESVDAAAEAVELRLDPTEQCAFQPLLDPDAPVLCGENMEETVVFEEDFEDGLSGWTLGGENPFGGPLRDWKTDSELPGTNDTIGAQGPAPDLGQCNGSTADFSSVNTMTSGDIAIPAEGLSPRLSFQHYVATELGFDGGNLQLSVDGGEFAPIPAAAYTFNAPGQLATEAAGNTNPLAGQDGFTGSDGGLVTGTWGESQVNLEAAGVEAGQTVQLRFAVGRDGCGGNDGWYVDDIKVVTCEAVATLTAAQVPNPSKYGTASAVDVTVAGGGDTAPTGTVTVTKGATTLGSATVDEDGKASIALPATLAVGDNALTASYSGDVNYEAVETAVSAKVSKATSKVTGTPSPTTVKVTKTITVSVKVTSTGVLPSGKFQVTSGGAVFASGNVVRGVGKGYITKDFPVGTRTFVVKYLGSDTVGTSNGSFTVKIVK